MTDMAHYIVKNDDGAVVGKYVRHSAPTVPDDLVVEQVSDVRDYSVNWDDQL